MPASAVSEVSTSAQVRAQQNANQGQSAPPPQVTVPAPSPTEQEIERIKKEIERLSGEIVSIQNYRENKYKESTSQTILAMTLETAEEAQSNDGGSPVDEFDEQPYSQPFSMGSMMRLRAIKSLRELVYGSSLGDIDAKRSQIADLNERLRELETQLAREQRTGATEPATG